MSKKRSFPAVIAVLMLLAIVCSLCGTAVATQPAQQQQEVAPLIVGDINRNAQIDSDDIRLILRHIVGTRGLDASRMPQADVNGDGKVNTIDVSIVMDWIVNGETDTAPTLPTTTVPTTTTTAPNVDDDGYYDDVVKP